MLAEPSEVGLAGRPRAVIIATGSEVALALNAQQQLALPENGRIAVRVVSMPSTTVFDRQDDGVEARRAAAPACRASPSRWASRDGWWKYGCAAVVGIDRYGESAPGPVLFKHFGFTAENVVATVRKVLSAVSSSPRKSS